MRCVYLAGRGLASSLGLDLPQAVAALTRAPSAPPRSVLPGALGGSYPFHAIPYQDASWDQRARHLVERVATEAGADQAKYGALFIATSSFDVGAAQQGAHDMDFPAFAAKIGGWLTWQGPIYVVSTACTSSVNALLAAQAMLSAGRIDDAVVLGLELDNHLTLGGFAAMQLLAPGACLPFGLGRDGLVLGEAVTVLRLSCRPASWRLAGGANVVDGKQLTGASAEAVANMCRRALAASAVAAETIDLIKVQAAGSPSNDQAEAQGLQAVFKPMPALISLKAVLGHTVAASGAAEIALLTACLEHNLWPRCNSSPDPALGVSLATQAPESVRHILATILGFGGSHATVVLERISA